MHFVTCSVALSGDIRNVIPRNEFKPVSWPEVEVLNYLHGEGAVTNIKPFVKVDQTAKAEKERLRAIYGSIIVENVFPGKNPQMEMELAGAKIPAQTPLWANPIDKDPALFGHKDLTAIVSAPKAAKANLPFNEG
jgi:hypothetical protein